MSLTFNTVLNALKCLHYQPVLSDPPPLINLMLVKDALADRQLSDVPHQPQVSLNHLLVSTIADTLKQRREVNNLPVPLLNDTITQAEAQIVAEARCDNIELTVASWLYYHYVRVDLDLSRERYCALIGIETRTLRRYHRYGVQRLTETLICRESQRMKADKRLHLLTALPLITRPKLYGREALLTRLLCALPIAQPSHLQIIGVPGIGKTALIHELAHRLIEQECLDQLVWIEAPSSVEAVYEQLHALTTQTGLVKYLTRCRVLVVLDDSQQLSKEAMDNLLQVLNPAQVVVINRQYRVLKHVLTTIAVPPMPEVAAKAYIRHVNSAQYPGYEHALTDAQIDRLWRVIGGHPQQIQRAIMAIWDDHNF